ncbi:MAG: GNAT family N-acetyltransferase [Dehalococcoidales bacterium]|nr:GNAT family N-acetyltransferase [Dehalococcoidales bacterium]
MTTVRRATAQDIPRILELYQQLFWDPDPSLQAPVEDCRKVLAEASKVPGYNLLVAEENGEVIGTTLFMVIPGFAHKTEPFAVIEYVVVAENKRSNGVGKILMDYCKELAIKSHCYKIILTSDKRRERAHKFYRTIGYEASAEGFRYYLKDHNL